MKLIGSKIEEKFRVVMINAHRSLFQEEKYERLLKLLKKHFCEMKTAYFLSHTPEEGEDIYQVLIDVNAIVTIEIERQNLCAEPVVKIVTIEQYSKKLSRIGQIKLAVALDLAQKDLNN